MLTENELKALADEGYNRIAVVEQCLADLDTPLSIYLKLANRAESFLLESVEGGTRFARYSFMDAGTHENNGETHRNRARHRSHNGRQSNGTRDGH